MYNKIRKYYNYLVAVELAEAVLRRRRGWPAMTKCSGSGVPSSLFLLLPSSSSSSLPLPLPAPPLLFLFCLLPPSLFLLCAGIQGGRGGLWWGAGLGAVGGSGGQRGGRRRPGGGQSLFI